MEKWKNSVGFVQQEKRSRNADLMGVIEGWGVRDRDGRVFKRFQ